MRRLAIGEITINSRGERIINDIDWNLGPVQIQAANIIPFGKINVFVGMVHTTEPGLENNMYKSGLEAAQSDGEESVGTTDFDLPVTTQEGQLEEPIWMPIRKIEEDEESIQELLEERYGYELEEEEHELSLGPIRRVGVYTTPATQLDPESVSAAAIATTEALAQNQQNQQNQLTIHNPSHIGIDGEVASGSSESEATTCRMNQFGFLLNTPAGENTVAPSNPAPFSTNLVLDPTVLEAVITPENAIIWARELDTARRVLEQQQKEFLADKEWVLARQKELDERESRLHHNTSIRENHQIDITRPLLGRHQSRFPLRGEALNPTTLFVTPNEQHVRAIQEVPAVQQGNLTGSVRLPTGGVRFHTPPGHYNNPTDNMYAATLALDRIPLGDSPREVETRRTIDMLRTAIVQQANYPDNRSGLHGTPYNSRSRQHEASSARRRNLQMNQYNPARHTAPLPRWLRLLLIPQEQDVCPAPQYMLQEPT